MLFCFYFYCRIADVITELITYMMMICLIYLDEDTSRPTPGSPTISISISEPTVIVIEAGRDINFTCTGRSLLSSVSIYFSFVVIIGTFQF